MCKKILFIFLIIINSIFLMTINSTPANAKKTCPIYWGIDKSEFLSIFPDAVPDPDDPYADGKGKHSMYHLSDRNPCAKKYDINDNDEVVFLFF